MTFIQQLNSDAFDTDALPEIDRLQRAAFGYFDRWTHPATGLVFDHSSPHAPASIAATGFGLGALPVGVERGWIARSQALQRALAAARFFDHADHDRIGQRGFFYHFLDPQSGERAWTSEVSSIDTALLALGLTAAASYFDGDDAGERELRDRVASIVARIDWCWMLDSRLRLRMGWTPERGYLKALWTGYSEALLIYALGLGAPQNALPAESYRQWRSGFRWDGDDTSRHTHAGPLFIHLFIHAWLDLAAAPTGHGGIDYVENSRRGIAAQRAYAAANPHGFAGYGADIWGLSASPGPGGRFTLHDRRRVTIANYKARAAPHGPDDGTLAPWAALASLPLAPEAAISGLRAIINAYPQVLHDGCFIDAFNPSIAGRRGVWYSARLTALDQGLVVLMVEWARSGLIHRLTSRAANLARGLAVIHDRA